MWEMWKGRDGFDDLLIKMAWWVLFMFPILLGVLGVFGLVLFLMYAFWVVVVTTPLFFVALVVLLAACFGLSYINKLDRLYVYDRFALACFGLISVGLGTVYLSAYFILVSFGYW